MCEDVSVKILEPSASSAIKWLANTNECFKRAAETSLEIAKGLVLSSSVQKYTSLGVKESRKI